MGKVSLWRIEFRVHGAGCKAYRDYSRVGYGVQSKVYGVWGIGGRVKGKGINVLKLCFVTTVAIPVHSFATT